MGVSAVRTPPATSCANPRVTNTNQLRTRTDTAEVSQKTKGRSKRDLPTVANALHDCRYAAARINQSLRTLVDLVRERKIGYCRIGRTIRFADADIDAFIEANRVKPIGWKSATKEGSR